MVCYWGRVWPVGAVACTARGADLGRESWHDAVQPCVQGLRLVGGSQVAWHKRVARNGNWGRWLEA